MSLILSVLLLIMLGGFAGILIGLLGIGGGIILVPMLYFILPHLGAPASEIPYLAIGTSLFIGSFGSLSAGINHFRSNNIILSKSVLLAAGSVFSAFITPYFVVNVNPNTLEWILGAVILAVAVKMLLENGSTSSVKKGIILNDLLLIFFGILTGIVSAFTGLGGGVLFVPILFYLYSLDIKPAIGSSSVAVAATMISSAVSYLLKTPNGPVTELQYGYVNFLAGIPLATGSIAGAAIGVKLVMKSSGVIIKRIFAVLLIIAIIKIIFDL